MRREKPGAWSHTIHAGSGYVRLASKRYVFIRLAHGARWEFYRIVQRGRSRGLEMFAGYIERAEQVARLEAAVRRAWQLGSVGGIASELVQGGAR